MQKAITKENEKIINDLTEEIGVAYGSLQNTLLTTVNKTLLKSIPATQDFELFKRYYLFHQGELNQTLLAEQDKFDKIIQTKIEEAEKVLGFKLKVKLPDSKKETDPSKATSLCVKAAKSYAASSYKQILKRETNRTVYGVEGYNIRKSTQDELQNAVFKQTEKGIENGLQIVYKNGIHMTFRNYMEMNIRTTVQSELSATQIKAGQMNAVVFYQCNSYFDCANDHADYQGRMYYDEEWESFDLDDKVKEKVADFIQEQHMLSVQDVRDNDPYLTTRPNCRHQLFPVTIQEALNLTEDEIMDKLNLKVGNYEQKNYKASQHLRYAERNIREYKDRVAMNEEMLKNAPQGMRDKIAQRILKDKQLVRKWQQEANATAKEFGFKRDYRREQSATMVQDLGARYNTPKTTETIVERINTLANTIQERQDH